MLQNSSKSYPKLYCVNNRECASIQISFLGESRILTSEDFFELKQIVNLSNTPQFKCQGFHSIVFSEQNLAMFHIFLYYCIKVHRGIQSEGLEKLYLTKLSSLYVGKNFKVQIGKFALMCSKCVNIKLRKCIHMIYFLIYGRLATNSYVNSLINQLNFVPSRRKDRLRTTASTKFAYKRGITASPQNKDQVSLSSTTECEQLADDLRQILYGNKKQQQNHNPFNYDTNLDNQNNQSDEDNSEQPDNKNQHSRTYRSQQKYYMGFFPNRVFNQQRSAIFQNMLPSHKLNYRLMRKKKFDDSKIQKMVYLTFNCDTLNYNDNQTKNQESFIMNKQRSKIFTQNAIKTNEKFKNSSIQLDRIRGSIINKMKKKVQNPFSIRKKNQDVGKKQHQYLQFIKNNIQTNYCKSKSQIQQNVKLDYENQNKFQNLLRKQQKNINKLKNDSQYKDRKKGQQLRISNNLTNQNNYPANKLIFHSECQNRVFQYKNQYRRFMKIHLFRDNDESIGKIL